MKIANIQAVAPALRKLRSRGVWEYAEKWECRVQLKSEGVLLFKISPGYWTDLASVPKALRGAFDNGSSEFGVLIASQVHDFLYSTHYVSKEFSDDLFRRVLRFYGMGSCKANLYYYAVRLFGGDAWNGNEDDIEFDRKFCAFEWLDR